MRAESSSFAVVRFGAQTLRRRASLVARQRLSCDSLGLISTWFQRLWRGWPRVPPPSPLGGAAAAAARLRQPAVAAALGGAPLVRDSQAAPSRMHSTIPSSETSAVPPPPLPCSCESSCRSSAILIYPTASPVPSLH